MPNLANAKKALRQSKKRARRNLIAKAEIKSMRIKFRKLMDAKKFDDAKTIALTIAKKLDKAQQKKMFKRNTVARYKSRIMRKLNKATAAK